MDVSIHLKNKRSLIYMIEGNGNVEKKKRIFYNLAVGLGGKIVLMVLGFFVPKLYIENYGSEINGLLSSIAQVFTYLALLEAGVGMATTQALYEPVACNDKDKINSIMSAASYFYRRTGRLYGIGVIAFAIIYPIIVPSSLNNLTVVLLITLSGANGVLNYFFQAKYFSLLNAEGKAYIHVAIGTAVSFVTTITKIILLAFSLNIVFVYLVYFIIGLVQISVLNIYIRKNYKYLNCKANPDFQAISQSNSVLVHQISSLVFSNTDVLILTAFCDLKTVSIYTIYSMVTESIGAILNIIFGSFTAALGLTYQENKKKFQSYFDLFELGTWMLSFIVMTVTFLLYTPFIGIYTAKADITYIDRWLPLLFVLCKLFSLLRMPAVNVVNVAGLFKETQTRAIIETIINLSVSLICVQWIGIYGVLLGTLAALLYRTTDFIVFTNRRVLQRKWEVIGRRLLVNGIVCVALIKFLFLHAVNITTVKGFIISGIWITLLTSMSILGVNRIVECKNENVSLFLQSIKRRIIKR